MLWAGCFLFSSSAFAEANSSCELLSKGPGVSLQNSEITLQTLLDEVLNDLKTGKLENFKRHFPKSSKVKSNVGDTIQALLDRRYTKPDFTIFRVWRIKSAKGQKEILDNCPESDGAQLISLWGHEKQFAIWIQVSGSNELGRIFLAAAPIEGKVSLIGARLQQWTQLEGDWQAWMQKAEQAQSPVDAYFKYDISQKLLDSQDLALFPQRTAIIEKRDQLFSQSSLVERMNKDLGTTSIAYVGSLMERTETGIFLRENVAPDEDAHKLKELCIKRGQALTAQAWMDKNQGIRCNYIVKGMDPRKDSPLGGFYVDSEELRKKQK